jgi:hypothetical protein
MSSPYNVKELIKAQDSTEIAVQKLTATTVTASNLYYSLSNVTPDEAGFSNLRSALLSLLQSKLTA